MSEIKYLSREMHDRLLGRPRLEIPRSKLREAYNKQERYNAHNLVDKLEPIDIYIPEEIPTAAECIQLAHKELNVDRVISRLEAFSRGSIPPVPENIPKSPGWWLHGAEGWRSGSYPTAVTAVFDFETVLIDGKPIPVCCSVVSRDRWWVWIWDVNNPQPVIDWGRNSLLIGHQVSYDRSFLANEYNYEPTGSLFPCTMSMWLATHGFGSQQSGLVRSKREELDFVPDWLDETGAAGLDDIYKFFTGRDLDKGVVKELVKGGLDWLNESDNFERLLAYNLADVKATFEIFCYLWPEYRAEYHNDHVKSIGDLMIYADLLHGKSWLPMSAKRWPTWYPENENRYQKIKAEIATSLRTLADKVLDSRLPEMLGAENPHCPIDATPYEKQLISLGWVVNIGWFTVYPIVEKYDVEVSTPSKERLKELRQKIKKQDPRLKSYLERSVRQCKKHPKPSDSFKASFVLRRPVPVWYNEKVLDDKHPLSLGSRITPLLMGCTWLKHPLYWEEGWMYGKGEQVPHPEERGAKVSSLFMQGMGSPIKQGVLSSLVDTSEVMKLLSQIRLWESFRKRFASIRTHNNVWITQDTRYPGTISYRASGMTQLLPNKHAQDKEGKHIYSDKLGCSIKSEVEAPPGFVIVGADLNSQELGIFAAIGDALNGFHGSQPGSVMNLLGSKADKTTLHWILALKAGIEYGLAKNCIYGSIYGLAVKGLKDYFMKANVLMPEEEATALAKETLDLLLGINDYGVLRGGLLSDSFNQVRKLAKAKVMRTVICGRKISKALRNLGKDYMTTRVNWIVQSAGSDQRELVVVWMHWLLKKYNINARLITPIHDEFRYCVAEDQVEDFNWCFQLCHVLMQAYTVDVLGLDGITCNHAYFPEVDLDNYLRKSVDDPVHTLCNPEPLPLGKVLRPVVLKGFIPSFAKV